MIIKLSALIALSCSVMPIIIGSTILHGVIYETQQTCDELGWVIIATTILYVGVWAAIISLGILLFNLI